MDKLGQRLRADAAAIDATVPAALRQRVDTARQTTLPVSPREHAPRRTGWLPGLASVVTGLAAVVLLVVWSGRDNAVEPPAVADTPAWQPQMSREIALRVEPAALTKPLQKELDALRADVEKARESIERDLRDSF
ncbi:MAG: hypothetical protein U5K76_10940 [Woeseiaceae bacterium]|nr:hypothetical protein [Woeseiaceae bacterium]